MRLSAAGLVLALAGLGMGPGSARAEELWAPLPLFPRSGTSATATWAARAGAGWSADVVPPFRAAARDRLSLGIAADAWLYDRVRIGLRGEWLRDATTAGVVSGFGDVHLGTLVHVATLGPIGVALGWEAKLPNAADQGEIGTDETDVLFGLGAGAQFGEFGLSGAVGLGILGNPLRFANQDDVPMLRLAGSWDRGMVRLAPEAHVDLATSRNPARGEAGVSARLGRRLFADAGAFVGLTPAAADWRVGLAVGWRDTLPAGAGGE